MGVFLNRLGQDGSQLETAVLPAQRIGQGDDNQLRQGGFEGLALEDLFFEQVGGKVYAAVTTVFPQGLHAVQVQTADGGEKFADPFAGLGGGDEKGFSHLFVDHLETQVFFCSAQSRRRFPPGT